MVVKKKGAAAKAREKKEKMDQELKTSGGGVVDLLSDNDEDLQSVWAGTAPLLENLAAGKGKGAKGKKKRNADGEEKPEIPLAVDEVSPPPSSIQMTCWMRNVSVMLDA